MSAFLDNIANAFADEKRDSDLASAQGIVPTILIIAGFSVVAILAVTWIVNSIAWKASEESKCITSQSTYSGDPSSECIGDSTDPGLANLSNQINAQKGNLF